MMQTVSKAPHTIPTMNATNTQIKAVMAMTAVVDKLLSGTGIKSRKRLKYNNGKMNKVVLYLCIGSEGQGSTFHLPHTVMLFSFPLV